MPQKTVRENSKTITHYFNFSISAQTTLEEQNDLLALLQGHIDMDNKSFFI
ncbi:MAG: hypothetical protein WC748_03270 [Legionellales bacterium]|jgi:hypothetical protein